MTAPLGTTTAGAALDLDLDRLLGGHACIIANSGGGKSGLVRKVLEATHGHVQHIILDIEDEFYTLRERYDYVIAGGDGGDVPAGPDSAKALALGALEHGFSLIVQMNDMGAAGAGEFVANFLEAMISAPRHLWRPVLVVIDEAQRFAPSGGGDTREGRAVRALTSQGRKRGFTAILASQRIAKVDPNVRGDINNWMLGRVGQALDRNSMADQLGFSAKEGREALTGIQDRHFWAFGPAIAAVPTLFRVGDVLTTPVRPGQAKIVTPPAPEALREILASMVPPPAEQKVLPGADISSETLKSWATADLLDELELRDPEWLQSHDEFRAALADRDMWMEKAQRFDACIQTAARALGYRDIDEIGSDIEEKRWAEGLKRASVSPGGSTGEATPVALPNPGGSHVDRSAAHAPILPGKLSDEGRSGIKEAGSGDGSPASRRPLGAERRPLAVLAGVYPSGLTEAQWSTAAGMKRTGGTWGTYKSRLRTAGMIEAQGDRWFATQLGARSCGDVETPPPPGPALVRWWVGKLQGVSPMADALIAEWPNWTSREALAEMIGMAAGGGTFGTYLSRLGGPGLIERDRDRGVRLSAEVMSQ